MWGFDKHRSHFRVVLQFVPGLAECSSQVADDMVTILNPRVRSRYLFPCSIGSAKKVFYLFLLLRNVFIWFCGGKIRARPFIFSENDRLIVCAARNLRVVSDRYGTRFI